MRRSKLILLVAFCGSIISIFMCHNSVVNVATQFMTESQIDFLQYPSRYDAITDDDDIKLNNDNDDDDEYEQTYYTRENNRLSSTTKKRDHRNRRNNNNLNRLEEKNDGSNPRSEEVIGFVANDNKNITSSTASSSTGLFPIRTHIVTQGTPRTATTLLFNMVAVSYFLYLLEYDPDDIQNVQLQYYQRHDAIDLMRRSTDEVHYILKTHSDLAYYLSDNAVVFTAAEDRNEAAAMRARLEKDGHIVAFVQDMETVKEKDGGLYSLIDVYVAGYNLPEKHRRLLREYFVQWEILRQCCGKQMSIKWRNDMMPIQYKIDKFGSHPKCATIDIDIVERTFMNTQIYTLIDEYPSVRELNKPSMKDDALNGTYCSSYNHLVRTLGLSFWGTPGGRPTRSKLDGAIKAEYKKGTVGLHPDAHYLIPISESGDTPWLDRLKGLWAMSEEKKKNWLGKVLAARKCGKTFKDYGIESTSGDDEPTANATTTIDDDNDDDDDDEKELSEECKIEKEMEDAAAAKSRKRRRKERRKQDRMGTIPKDLQQISKISKRNEYVDGASAHDGTDDVVMSNDAAAEEDDSDENEEDLDSMEDIIVAADEDNGIENLHQSEIMAVTGLEETSSKSVDNTHAIFLISFGSEAATSTLVERCILSLRRRGAYDGYVILLTDAPSERYHNVWDENVFVMHPLEEHLNADDGTPFEFTESNFSLKSKRFKTFIIDYIDMEKGLDSVELVYYLDVDIMAGDSFDDFFTGLETKYEVSRNERSGGVSKLYFFTPLSEEWPLQGGTFIVERRSSRHCLELWRKEIDDMTVSGRGRDQDALRNIYQRIESGDETRCKLVRMENENFISFPTPRTFKKITQQSSFPSLIHISNSVFAKWIDEEMQTKYIHKVLQLSDDEIQSQKYGTAVITPKKSDMT